jgi:hypothetical protein
MQKAIQKKLLQPEEIILMDQLYKIPKKDKGPEIPSYKRGGAQENEVYSSDVLYMPSDKGYKYLLVLVDVITGITQAEPLKTHSSVSVLKAFKEIFKKMKLPSIIQVDAGTEFKGVVEKYFKENHVLIRVGDVGRSRQQAMVESRNKSIAIGLFQKQNIKELQLKKTNTKWVDDIHKVIEAINNHEAEIYKKNKITNTLPYIPLDAVIFEVGTKVRVALDKPEGILGNKLKGRFRATDIRWSHDISTISNVIITPNQPIMYQVDGLTTGYTFNQLQQPIVKKLTRLTTKQKIRSKFEFNKDVAKLDNLIPKVLSNIDI